MSYPHLAMRIYNSPLLLTPGKAEVIEQVFRAHNEGRAVPPKVIEPRKELQTPGITKAEGGYYRTTSGIALIPIIGTMVQRGDSMDAMSGLVGYNRIATQLQAAVDDPRVDAILLEIDSNGGEAAGIMDLAGKIAAADKRKPTWAVANEAAFSAAYWLASASGRVSAPESAMVGSIGVVMMHVDQSVRDAKQGVTYTPVYAGDRKVDFSSHAPLSDAALQVAQDEVDRVYDLFVAAIADGRSMDPQAVRDTQAGLFHAKAALDLGLIDAVESFDATLSALTAEAQRFRVYGPSRAATSARVYTGEQSMTTTPKEPAGAAVQSSVDQLTEAQARGFTEGKVEGIKAGAADERTRIAAILTHAEAGGRRSLAEHLAFKTGNTVEEAAALLAVSPKEAAAATNLLAEKMAGIKQPNVGADVEVVGTAGPVLDMAKVYSMRREAIKAAS